MISTDPTYLYHKVFLTYSGPQKYISKLILAVNFVYRMSTSFTLAFRLLRGFGWRIIHHGFVMSLRSSTDYQNGRKVLLHGPVPRLVIPARVGMTERMRPLRSTDHPTDVFSEGRRSVARLQATKPRVSSSMASVPVCECNHFATIVTYLKILALISGREKKCILWKSVPQFKKRRGSVHAMANQARKMDGQRERGT
jgi:hypothetical protein